MLEIPLAKTELADIFLLKHGAETLNLAPRQSVCAFRGIHFLEEHPFVLGFEKREWLVEKGCAFLTERGTSSRVQPPSRDACGLFEFSISLPATACQAMSLSSGPIGGPARSSFARRLA